MIQKFNSKTQEICHLYTSHSKVPETKKMLSEEIDFGIKTLLVINLFITELKSENVATMNPS